ncbi:hypothetical protein MesoLjLc_58050 [Mesorhizobium sp. L-8-10]|nr:hypothetical protein MesoLjLc_58050 [Mesorhizobium sp. L-8-10]
MLLGTEREEADLLMPGSMGRRVGSDQSGGHLQKKLSVDGYRIVVMRGIVELATDWSSTARAPFARPNGRAAL